MKDRVVQYPNRFKLTPVSGTSDTYDITAVPGTVTEAGDDFSKANFLPDSVKTLLNLPQSNPQIKDALSKLSGAPIRVSTPLRTVTTLGAFSVGTTITLDGVSYKIIAKDYLAAGSVLLEKTTFSSQPIFGANTTYAGSTVDTACTDYYNNLSATLRAIIKPATIASNGGTLSRNVFILSATEYGIGGGAYVEGTQIALYNSDAARIKSGIYWTRSKLNATYCRSVATDGTGNNDPYTQARNIFPCICVDSTANIYLDTDGKYYSAQSYANGFVDMAGNEFPLPHAKISVGSYTGSGAYGNGSPNSLTFSFTPKRISLINSSGVVFGELIINGTTVYGYSYVSSFAALVGTISGNTVSWYNTSSAAAQLNASGVTYLYEAEG